MKKNVFASVAVLLAIVVVFGAGIFGVDKLTAPIIEKNKAASATGALAEVLPGGVVFEALDLSALQNVPASVTAIHKETSGLGYVLSLSTTSSYSTAPLQFLLGVDAAGAIAGMKVESYNETKGKAEDFIPGFLGENSTLATVEQVAGVTYTFNAFKNAITEGFAVLSANGLMEEAKKGDEQILKELIPTVHTGLVNNGSLKATELGAPGLSAGGVQILTALKADNGSGFAFIAQTGENKVLAVVNAGGACTVYNVEGKDVTADNADVVTEATAMAKANAEDNSAKEMDKLQRMLEGSTATALPMDGIYSTVVGVYDLGNGNTGFVARSYGFEIMDVYYILDANGAIVKMTADTFIFEKEYFMNFAGMDEGAYKDGFAGLTKDTFTGEQAIIATATMTSEAVKTATNDIFAAFETMKGGAQ